MWVALFRDTRKNTNIVCSHSNTHTHSEGLNVIMSGPVTQGQATNLTANLEITPMAVVSRVELKELKPLGEHAAGGVDST